MIHYSRRGFLRYTAGLAAAAAGLPRKASAGAAYAYDHSASQLATTTMSVYWNADDPEDSQVVGFVYPEDGARPNNYYREISVFLGTVGLDGRMNNGDLRQVQAWKVFMYPQGDRVLMKNDFFIHNMATNKNYFTWLFRHPTNTTWVTSIGSHRSGIKI